MCDKLLKKKMVEKYLISLNFLFYSRTESAVSSRKTPPVDGQKSHVDVSGNTYSQEHDSTSTSSSSLLQSKDDSVNTEQVAASFGDMNISVAVKFTFFSN